MVHAGCVYAYTHDVEIALGVKFELSNLLVRQNVLHCKTDMVIPSYENWEKHTLVITDFSITV